MATTFRGKLKGALVAGAALSALCVLLLLPTGATASWSGYCENNKLNGHELCVGASRVLHGEFGWGDQHSVCVKNTHDTEMCSSGPEAGVYNPIDSSSIFWISAQPWIINNAAGWNYVHGLAEVP